MKQRKGESMEKFHDREFRAMEMAMEDARKAHYFHAYAPSRRIFRAGEGMGGFTLEPSLKINRTIEGVENKAGVVTHVRVLEEIVPIDPSGLTRGNRKTLARMRSLSRRAVRRQKRAIRRRQLQLAKDNRDADRMAATVQGKATSES